MWDWCDPEEKHRRRIRKDLERESKRRRVMKDLARQEKMEKEVARLYWYAENDHGQVFGPHTTQGELIEEILSKATPQSSGSTTDLDGSYREYKTYEASMFQAKKRNPVIASEIAPTEQEVRKILAKRISLSQMKGITEKQMDSLVIRMESVFFDWVKNETDLSCNGFFDPTPKKRLFFSVDTTRN